MPSVLNNLALYIGSLNLRLRDGIFGCRETENQSAVHKTRVICRRLREPLELCQSQLKILQTQKVLKRLKSLRNTLQHVRDLDVLYESTECNAVHPIPPNALVEAKKQISTLREQAGVEARAKITTKQIQAIPSRVGTIVDNTTQFDPDSDATVMAAVDERWCTRLEKALHFDPQIPTGQWHVLRLQLKRFRYLTDLKSALQDSKDEELTKSLKKFHDLLGAHNDHLFAAHYMADLATAEENMLNQPTLSKELLYYAGGRMDSAARTEHKLQNAWANLRELLQQLHAQHQTNRRSA